MKLISRIAVILIFLLTIFLLFYKLDKPAFERWDEQINVQVVNESLSSENFLVFKYQGLEFFDKPPLWYYLTMLIVKFTGPTVIAFRAVNAVSGLIICFLIFSLTRKHLGLYAGIVSVAALLSISHLFINNPLGTGQFFSTHTLRSADLDGLQILLLVLSLWLFDRVKNNRKYFYLGFMVLGLAFLTKGPFTLIPLVFYCWYFYRKRLFYRIKVKNLIIGLLLFFATILPWHILMLYYSGQYFINSYLGYHILSRLTIPLEGHSADIFFYIKIFLNFSAVTVWTLALLALVNKFKLRISNLLLDFSRFMFPATIIFFSLVQTKLAWYILPAYPFVAILVAWYSRILYKQKYKLLLKFLFTLLLLTGLGINTLNIYRL
ncbi:MAG TPA: glycosyltransferase family 39 protein [Candidatus Dojkabacteria bacterium]|nr:glycosyltransferase family 39 protein [Candidatus Dojkabacteria bacterium]